MIDNTAEFARKLDNNDNLHKFRSLFIKPEFNNKPAIYFLGNSLGLQPLTAFTYIKEVLEEWSEFGVEGFFKGSHPWIEYHNRLVEPLSSITGALPEEIVVMNQLTVNLHLMLISFYNPKNNKKKILCDHKAFPSDQYMLESHLKQRGLKAE
ncbi:MAG: kynureninase, partial [Flavisolibacter sp.]